jgi:hypothetical protein
MFINTKYCNYLLYTCNPHKPTLPTQDLGKLTIDFSTCTAGRAEGYRRNNKLIPTPIRIPYSTAITRHVTKVANVGIKSLPSM